MSSRIACTNFLEHFVNLTVLSIQYFVDSDSDTQHRIGASFPRLLHLLPIPSQLRQLVFSPKITDRKPTREDFDWVSGLDAELAREHFHGLTEVAYHFDVFLDKEDQSLAPFTSKELITELIEGKLPKLSSRRPPVLRINVTTHDWEDW